MQHHSSKKLVAREVLNPNDFNIDSESLVEVNTSAEGNVRQKSILKKSNKYTS
jgi:hypothetical protein